MESLQPEVFVLFETLVQLPETLEYMQLALVRVVKKINIRDSKAVL